MKIFRFGILNILKRVADKLTFKIIANWIYFQVNGDFWKLKTTIDDLNESPRKKKYRMAYNELLRRNGSWIGDRAKFEGRPEFPHGIKGIFISHGARIGERCTIFQQVTIGSNLLQDSKTKGAPTIGDDCYIGAGAKIIGNVCIGNNCRIGANCIVSKDMPDNSVAVLQPPRIIKKDEIDNKSQIPLEAL